MSKEKEYYQRHKYKPHSAVCERCGGVDISFQYRGDHKKSMNDKGRFCWPKKKEVEP